MSRYGYRHHFGHKWGYGEASFIRKPPEAVEVVDEETIDRFPAPITVQPPRPTFSWVQTPQIEQDITTELRRFSATVDRSRPIVPLHSFTVRPQLEEEIQVERLPFLTVSDFQPRIRPPIGFRRGVAGAPMVVLGKFLSVTDRQPPIAPIQRIFIPQIEEAVEVERLPFVSAPDPGSRISYLASLIVTPQIIEEFSEELRKFHVGPDRIRPIREFASVVRPPQIPVLEALRRFELGADRQRGLPVPESRIIIPQIPEIVVLPIELLKFITGSPRLRWEFIHRTGMWLPENFTSEVVVVVRRKEVRRGWYRSFGT